MGASRHVHTVHALSQKSKVADVRAKRAGGGRWVQRGSVLAALASACSDPPAAPTNSGAPAMDAGREAGNGGPTCNNRQKDNVETDVDCGGAACQPCDVNQACASGSDCMTGACDQSLCVLASGPPFWLPGVPMTTARSGLGAATYFSFDRRGKLIAIGGFLERLLDTYEVFDPETLRWTSGRLPEAPCCRLPGVSGPDGRVYYVYGDRRETWVYDGAWSRSLAPPPAGCVHAGLALGSDRLLYVLCSHDSQLPPNPLMTYDTELDEWAALKPTPTPAVNPPWVTSLASRIYVVSTSDGNRYPLEAYDVGSGTWSTLASPPVPSVIVGAPDGRVYAVAGFDIRGPIYQATGEVHAYSPETDRWTQVASLDSKRYDHAATVGPDGRLYTLGGVYNGAPNTESVEVYGPAVSIAPSIAAAGDAITLTGINFAAMAEVRAYLGPTKGAALGVGTTDVAGALNSPIAFRVPSVPSGNYVITVVDDKSRYPVTLPLRVRERP